MKDKWSFKTCLSWSISTECRLNGRRKLRRPKNRRWKKSSKNFLPNNKTSSPFCIPCTDFLTKVANHQTLMNKLLLASNALLNNFSIFTKTSPVKLHDHVSTCTTNIRCTKFLKATWLPFLKITTIRTLPMPSMKWTNPKGKDFKKSLKSYSSMPMRKISQTRQSSPEINLERKPFIRMKLPGLRDKLQTWQKKTSNSIRWMKSTLKKLIKERKTWEARKTH